MIPERTDTPIVPDPFGIGVSSQTLKMPDPYRPGSGIKDVPKAAIELTGTQKEIAELMWQIKEMLLEKNRKYGDSALEPTRIYSKASPLEQINVRIDDKLSRIVSSQTDEDEDIDIDLIGYLILRIIAKRRVKVGTREDLKYQAAQEEL